MEMYNVLDARNNLSRLVARAQAGEEIVITRRGVPAARLVPVEAEPRLSGKAFGAWLAQNAPIRAERSAADIEAQIREERDSWD
ncbi:MAG: type II toxin-antitoxin system prevent-host-death family antitoxin [Herbiconiux sp.]|nr:type II toxin-antitoxin system prevent-host-death family antitoxin [Herbiconiux sp.]